MWCALCGGGAQLLFETRVFKDGVADERNIAVMDRLVKSLLWVHGGYHIQVSGSKKVFEHLKAAYQAGGKQAFDAKFMANVFEQPFTVTYAENPDMTSPRPRNPPAPSASTWKAAASADAGGSDRKVSAVIDGKAVFSEEVVWFPKVTADPEYPLQEILSAFNTAASHLPRVDAIGVSSAGIYIDNRVMNASPFPGGAEEIYKEKVTDMYIKAAKAIGGYPPGGGQ